MLIFAQVKRSLNLIKDHPGILTLFINFATPCILLMNLYLTGFSYKEQHFSIYCLSKPGTEKSIFLFVCVYGGACGSGDRDLALLRH